MSLNFKTKFRLGKNKDKETRSVKRKTEAVSFSARDTMEPITSKYCTRNDLSKVVEGE